MCETVLCLKKPKKKKTLWPSLCFTVPPFSTGNICLCFAIFTVCRRALCAPFGQRRGHVVKFVIACEGRQINSDTLAFSPKWEVQNVTFHSWRPVSGRSGYYWVESGVSLAPASFNVCPLYGYLPKNICTRFALSVHFALKIWAKSTKTQHFSTGLRLLLIVYYGKQSTRKYSPAKALNQHTVSSLLLWVVSGSLCS